MTKTNGAGTHWSQDKPLLKKVITIIVIKLSFLFLLPNYFLLYVVLSHICGVNTFVFLGILMFVGRPWLLEEAISWCLLLFSTSRFSSNPHVIVLETWCSYVSTGSRKLRLTADCSTDRCHCVCSWLSLCWLSCGSDSSYVTGGWLLLVPVFPVKAMKEANSIC